MKATELRIGNIVSVYGTNGFPDGWKEQAVNAENIKTCVSHPDWFTPVKLTEKRLIKFGFKCLKQSAGQYILINENDVLLEVFFGFRTDGKMEVQLNDFEFQLKHIHQLQNLYFALTGKELTIKP